ncbi:hypothetical protein K1720_04190 [Thermococcus argininiproducens]|uniref:Uncharacterized protein n=1 Tax=Thermococcus argininiproducens TaxID=2866384 RepID=A0A9E7MAU4_9EURY|nr:hypothetical protein [Thermococcus argininiproducens]USH00647.1 hypothetical protein K1720_04190 [Thermococcus argininiproducens]
MVIIISLVLQTRVSQEDIQYSLLIFDNKSGYQSIYSPSASSVKVSLIGSGHATVSIRDVELNQTIYFSKISGSSMFSIIFPHPGYYEFYMDIENGGYSVSMSPVEVGFPTKTWNVHFLYASLIAFVLVFLNWGKKNDSSR